MYARALAFLLSCAAFPAFAQSLRITHIDVEQADATLFVSPAGNTLLVDTGKNGHGSRIRAAMARTGVTRIDHLVITHYHEDHYGGADDLVAGPNPLQVVNVHDRGDKVASLHPPGKLEEPTFVGYETSLGHRAHHLMRGETIPLDPAMLVTCISSGSAVIGEDPVDHGHDENDMSVSLLIQFGNFRYFVGGDIEAHTEGKIAARNLVMDIDVYQANHHGSDTSTSDAFLGDLMPTLVVISNGDVLKYKHPKQSTLDKFTTMNPAPVVLQTNKYLKGGDGGNVADEFIADVVPAGAEGDIVVTVKGDGSYAANYRGMSQSFQSKPRTATTPPSVAIVSLLPNPVGEDRDLEEVELRNNTPNAISISDWFLRDASGRLWSLASLGQLQAGAIAIIRRGGMAMSLDNGGDTIAVVSGVGVVVHEITYGPTSEGIRVSP